MNSLLLAVVGIAFVNAFSVQKQDVLEQLRNRVLPVEAQTLTGQKLADYVNENQAFFRAEPSKFSPEDMRAKVMNIKYLLEPEHAEELVIDATIPDSFDAREQWPQCTSISTIRDQSDCGSCWAFGAAEAISDRICIASNGQINVDISSDDVLSCCGRTCGDGCEGGYPIEAWRYWVKHGICTGGSYESQTGCKPYPIPPCGHHVNQTYYGACPTDGYSTPKCTTTCVNGSSASYTDDKHYGKSAYGVAKTVSAIQKEIMINGPVEVAYTVYEDFYQYTGGVYVHTAGKEIGGHAVKLLGWGIDNGTPYWLVANSWNTDWGENGYFRIVRGLNECGIEHAVVAGLAK